jgi:hypothetical protein
MISSHFYTKDFPEANGRIPVQGEHAYTFTFHLADGDEVVIHCGDETLEKFREFLGSRPPRRAPTTTTN